MTIPFFSIIIPVHNTLIAYMKECFESVLSQTFKAFEVILVDDGSNQETADFCDSYSIDERVRVIHQANQGVSAARNYGIEQAAGKWILFLDADDWLEKNACELLHDKLQGLDCDILLFNCVREYSEKQIPMKYGLQADKLYNMTQLPEKELLYKRAMGVPAAEKGWTCIITYAWDKVYSKDFLIRSGVKFPVGIRKSEDKLFILSCFEKMETLFYYEKVFYHYRMNEASVCNRYSSTADKERKVLVDRLSEIAKRMDTEIGTLTENPLYDEISQELMRFTFGLISDVLLLKYYHKDNQCNAITRHREALQFIATEPFAESVRNIRYSELSNDAKIKKLLLSHKCVGLFCFTKKMMNIIRGKTIASE